MFIADIRQDTIDLVNVIKTDTSSYRADNVSKTKCPACGKNMLLVNGKRGKVLACPDRNCGYRQEENEDIFSRKGNSRATQRLIAQYSDQEELGTSLGEKLKAAMEKKNSG